MRLSVLERRGSAIEATHPISAVLVDATGRVLERVGPETVTTWRSAAKPFQLEASLSLLPPALVARFEDADLALGAASHSGQPAHVARVRGLFGLMAGQESELRCGAHEPVHDDSARALWRAGEGALPVHNNCSGKHAFMIGALAAAGGAGLDYRESECAIQRKVRRVVDERTGHVVLGTVTDGCGVPCFVLPLEGMARAWASVSVSMDQPDSVLGRIGWAMSREPWWMSGDGRIDLDIVRGATRPMVSKVGAAGLWCAAVPGLGIGIAIKALTGADAARPVAVAALLDRWVPGLLPESVLAPGHEVRNVAGALVGKREAVWD